MKNVILIGMLVSSLIIMQGCNPKSEQSSAEQKTEAAETTLAKEQYSENVKARRAAFIKAKAEKEEQRTLVLLEKMKLTPTYTDASGRIVYHKVEVQPSYSGGTDELNRYLKENLKYPADAREKSHEGTVFVDFVIDANGKVREVVASDVVGEYIDESFKTESVRVVAAMPGWKPGLQNGRAVDASYSIPITFQMKN